MWGITVAHSAILQSDARATRADSLMLKVHSQEVRGAHRLSGASDVDSALVTTLIAGASLCVDCIARKTGLTIEQAVTAFRVLGKEMKLSAKVGRCDACLGRAVIHRLG